MKKTVLAYVTTRDSDEAEILGAALIKSRIAACVNIIPSMVSMYWWQGKIERAREAILIVKTVASKKRLLIQEIKKLHSYSVPCILFIPTDGGNLDYLNWLNQETNLLRAKRLSQRKKNE